MIELYTSKSTRDILTVIEIGTVPDFPIKGKARLKYSAT